MQQLERTGDVIVRFTAIDDIIERPVGRGRQQSRGDQGKKLPMLGRVTEKSLKGDARSHQARSVPFCIDSFLGLTWIASMTLYYEVHMCHSRPKEATK
jgi:hypothetical protein